MAAEAPPIEPGLVVHFELTRADLLAYSRYHVRHDRQIQQPLLLGYPLAVLIAALLAFAQSLGEGGMEAQAFLVGLLVATGGLFVAYPLFLYFYPRALTRHAVHTPGLLGPHAVEVFPSGLTHLSQVAEGRHEWTTVQSITATPAAIYFRINHFQTVIVPRSAFFDHEASEHFLTTARRFRDAARMSAWHGLTTGSEVITIPDGALVLSYELHAEDIQEFVRHHLLHQGLRTTLLALAGMACLGAWAMNGGFLGGVLYVAAGALVLWVLLPRWVLRRMCELPGVLGPRVLAFTEDGIIGWTEALGDGTLAWSGIYDLAVTPQHLFFYYGPAVAIVVPARTFPAPEEMDSFLQDARTWIRQSRKRD